MPRDIPVSNGSLLVCFDKNYQIRDLYFPHVGQENHVGGEYMCFGVWAENRFSWINHEWNPLLQYEKDTLVTSVELTSEKLELRLLCRDVVDFHENIYLRELKVKNLAPKERIIHLFFHQDFNISGNDVGDTAAFDPKTGGIIHYKGRRYFLANVKNRGSDRSDVQFATGRKKVQGKEGTFKDAEDGILSGNPIAQGSVDSVISTSLVLKERADMEVYYWISAGESWEEVRRLDALVWKKGAKNLIKRTADYWRLWIKKENPPLEILSEKTAKLYRRSLLILRTQIDWNGGILAANDSDVIQFNRDTYSYIWPRDGALVANALDMAGYPIPARDYYQFIADRIEKEGFLLHKYNPDGSLASSWHPWFENGKVQLPIQEDETALVVWALLNHFVIYRDIEFIKPLYRPFIKRAADFMCKYRDGHTGLPDISYDLWEERRGILSFTVGAVFGGLTAASLFCSIFGEDDRSAHYRQVAAEIRDAASRYLWRENLNRFCRMINVGADGTIEVDATCDMSLWGLFAFGLYAADDPRIVSTMRTLREKLWVNTKVGGIVRYENDGYNKDVNNVYSNPWFVCTLWFADYITAKSVEAEDLKEAFDILDWVEENTLDSGVMAEQLHPLTGKALSVSPLTWSHATFIATCQHIMKRYKKMQVCPACKRTLYSSERRDDWIDHLFDKTCDTIHGICRL